ncbi:YncE family protein [Viridibacterium curvum]|uniref:BACON domain-containing protein n=1 Tax=Viridibacterium curvum TaxID=1101404 RepID=A0ABP9QIR4_9RHOO
MWHAVSKGLVLFFSVLLVACGGGGGGGSGGSGGGGSSTGGGDFTLSTSSLSLTAPQNSKSETKTVSLLSIGPDAYYVAAGVPPGHAWPAWLGLSFDTYGDNAFISASTYGLATGKYTATVRFVTKGATGNVLAYRDLSITLTVTASGSSSSSSSSSSIPYSSSSASSSAVSSSVAASLSATPNKIDLGGSTGRAHSSQSAVFINTNKSGDWNWSIESKPAWVKLIGPSSGVMNGGTYFWVEADLTKLSPGTQSGMMSIKATQGAASVSTNIPVSVTVDTHKLVASEVGIAFARTPDWSRLSRTITLRDNLTWANWTATSNQPWLTVTPSGYYNGYSDSSLTLTANVAGLASDQFHRATVTISAANGALPETIEVGLWNGSTTPGSQTIINGSFVNVVADPVRPRIYTHTGGNSISAYNTYLGTIAGSISLSGNAGAMEVSADGKRLFAVQGTNISVIDLDSLAVIATWANTTSSDTLRYARPNGEGLLIASGGRVFKVGTGSVLSTNAPAGPALAVSPDSSYLFSQDTGISPGSFSRYSIDYSDASSNGFIINSAGSGSGGSNCKDIAVTRNSQYVLTACGAPYSFARFSYSSLGSAGTLAANPYPNNVKAASDGRIFAASANYYDSADFWVYGADGTLQKSFLVRGYAKEIRDRQLVPSGDALMAAAITLEPALHLIPVGPEPAGTSSLTTGASSASKTLSAPASTGSTLEVKRR